MNWIPKSIQGLVAGNKISHPENYFHQPGLDGD